MEDFVNYAHSKYNKLCNYLQQDTVGSQLTIYGVASGMLLLAYVKRRPTYLLRQYKKPAHIPNKLIVDRVPLTGIIKDIQQKDQDTLLVLISHRPWFPLFSNRQRTLPIKLPGVKINGNGYAWLQNCLVGKEATFIPLKKQTHKDVDYVISQMCLLHPEGDKARLWDVSETLLKLRFAKYSPDAVASAKKYYKHLQRVENSTEKWNSWIAWAAGHPMIWRAWHDLQAKMLPKQKLLPELVR